MSVATTPLEKFLLQAIRTAKEEIYEEVDALMESSDKEASGSIIKKILDDLLRSAEHFDSFDIEEVTFRDFKYEIGETVGFSGAVYMATESKAKLFGYKTLHGFDSNPPESPGIAEIIERTFDPNIGKEVYIVQMNCMLYFTDEEELSKKR